MREENHIIHLGAEVPVAARWEWHHGAWYNEGDISPKRIEELLQEKKEVYVISPTDGRKVRVRRCKPVQHRVAWRVMVELQCARGNEVAGGVIVDEHAEIYDHTAKRWVTVPEIARGEGAFSDNVRLAARRSLSDMYELEAEERVEVSAAGQMRLPFGKLAVTDIMTEGMRRAFDSYGHFTLRSGQTCPATPLHTPRMNNCSLIGVIPLRAHDSLENQKLNMGLYFLLRDIIYVSYRRTHTTEAYLLPADREWAPHGAFAFRLWISRFHGPIYFSCKLQKLIMNLKEVDLSPALHLITADESEKNFRQLSRIFDPSAVKPDKEEIRSLFKRPLRALFTEAIQYSDSKYINMTRTAVVKPTCCATPRKYKRIFTPDEIAASTVQIPETKQEDTGISELLRPGNSEAWERLREECKRAWDERRAAVVDYAIMRMDANFGFRLADKYSKTPEEYRELQEHSGWPRIPFKYEENPQPPGTNWIRIGSVGCCEGMQYVMFISKVEGHNREKRERFFRSIRQLFETYQNTPRWNGARAHELMFFPKSIPENCTCRWCRIARENQTGSR